MATNIGSIFMFIIMVSSVLLIMIFSYSIYIEFAYKYIPKNNTNSTIT